MTSLLICKTRFYETFLGTNWDESGFYFGILVDSVRNGPTHTTNVPFSRHFEISLQSFRYLFKDFERLMVQITPNWHILPFSGMIGLADLDDFSEKNSLFPKNS